MFYAYIKYNVFFLSVINDVICNKAAVRDVMRDTWAYLCLRLRQYGQRVIWFLSCSDCVSVYFSGLCGFERDFSHRDPRKSRVCGVCLQLGHEPAHINDLPHAHRQATLSTDIYPSAIWIHVLIYY